MKSNNNHFSLLNMEDMQFLQTVYNRPVSESGIVSWVEFRVYAHIYIYVKKPL